MTNANILLRHMSIIWKDPLEIQHQKAESIYMEFNVNWLWIVFSFVAQADFIWLGPYKERHLATGSAWPCFWMLLDGLVVAISLWSKWGHLSGTHVDNLWPIYSSSINPEHKLAPYFDSYHNVERIWVSFTYRKSILICYFLGLQYIPRMLTNVLVHWIQC